MPRCAALLLAGRRPKQRTRGNQLSIQAPHPDSRLVTGPSKVLIPRVYRRDALLYSQVQRSAKTEPGSGSIPTRPGEHPLMNRTQEARIRPKAATSFMFPQLHEAIVAAALEISPRPKFENDKNLIPHQEYSTSIIAKFACNNHGGHRHVWASKKVSLVIRGYAQNRYNAVVYGQRCEICQKLGAMTLNQKTYIERVSYRLKKWACIPVVQPTFTEGKKGDEPHRSDLCEGCKVGNCSWGFENN